MLTFLSPVFLVGMLAAAIPLVIHLSRSRRRKRMAFSTTRFFTDQFVRSYRMSRLKELLLLAARMALFAILATALARPVLMAKGRAYLTGRRCVVFVLDNSASMGYEENGISLFEQAKASTFEVLQGLREGDSAGVVLAGRRHEGPEILFSEPTLALGDVRQAVEQLAVGSLGTDLTGALTQAEQLVRKGKASSREIYVLSDLQDSGWEMGNEADPSAQGSDLLYFFIHLRPHKIENLAVTAVQYANAKPAVGIPFSVRPHVQNGGGTITAVDVALFIDGQKVGEKNIESLQAGRWAVPRFHHTFSSGGWHSGYVELVPSTKAEQDGLKLDNRRYFAFEVLESMHILAVNGSPSTVKPKNELFFLKAALVASAEGQSPVVLEEVSPAQLEQTDLSAFPVVILANVESLSLNALDRLETFVDGGGSLLIFLGDKANAVFYNEHLVSPARLHGGLLPATLEAIVGAAADTVTDAPRVSESVGAVDYGHPALVAFEDPGFANLAAIEFATLWHLRPSSDALVLMEAGTGYPLLCEKAFGKGRVVLFASTCDRDWTDFPVRPAFLPWIHRLVSYLAQEPLTGSGFITTGQHVPMPVSASTGIEPILVKRPGGDLGNPIATDDPDMPLVYTATDEVGTYEIRGPEQESPATLFVANLPSYESQLTYLDDVLFPNRSEDDAKIPASQVETGLKELLPGRPLLNYVGEPEGLQEASLRARRGIRLWDAFLVAALILALVEPWFANRISLRHYTNPEASPEGFAAPPRQSGIFPGYRETERAPMVKEAGTRQ
ncbi:MAG: VWA domain-containing protein [Candidatus Hydrogenedentes bacterium]|nr:VWA domain-containing protein [Candidatus Hydrogenedentota bacterium]